MLNILANVLNGVHLTPDRFRSYESNIVLAKILEDHARYVRGELSEQESVALLKTTVAYSQTMCSILKEAVRDAR
jgi:hypothetical protein